MPEMDGFEVMDGLDTVATNGYLPVIVLTAQPGHKLVRCTPARETSSANPSTYWR